jgi:hypothetical protein
MSLAEQTGLAISVYRPTIVVGSSYDPTGRPITDDLARRIGSYEHTIASNGGYWSASFSLSGPLVEMEEWLTRLGYHIQTYNKAGIKIFEGFVNRVDLSAGTLTAARGPLMDVANRISVTYTPILDATTTPPTMGTQTTTTIAENATSQARYAILESVIDGGRLLDDGTTDAAAQLRDTYLAEMANPESTEELGLGTSSEPSVTVEILGYAHWLQRFVVQDLTATTIAINTKIQNALGADPNGLFSTDYTRIDSNPFLIPRYEDDNRMAWDVIQEAVEIGDASDNRYTFGIYNDRRAVYTAMPTSVAYQHRIASPNMDVLTLAGTLVDPWNVLPARWLFLPDFMVGLTPATTMREDPRYMFIESVQFTAPDQIQISGSRVSTIPQMLAKQGMWG